MASVAHGTALVADDHGLYRMGLAHLLMDEFGFASVVQAATFDEALEKLEAGSMELALFDLSMPGMGGPRSLAVVRECYPGVRVAVVSASEQRDDVLEALEAGVHGYISKSLPDATIASALRTVLDGEIYTPRFLATSRSPAGGEPASGTHVVADPPTAADELGPRLARLTPRQRSVFALVGKGLSNKEIARELGIAEGTVKIHLAALFGQLGVKNRVQAAALAARAGPR